MGTSKKWSKAEKAFHLFKERDGATLSAEDIAEVAGWTLGTAITYINKKWAGLLTPTSDGRFEV